MSGSASPGWRGPLVSALKVVLVALLMFWVFTNIQWTDALVVPGAEGEVRLEGTIVGAEWKAEEVRFLPEGAEEPRVVVRGDPASGKLIPGFLTYWRALDPLLFAVGALMFGVVACLSAFRWWWLLRINDLPVAPLEALRLTWIGIFFNNVVPGQTGGDLVKAIYVLRRCPGQRAEALVSVGVDRILGLGSLALLGAFAVLFVLEEYPWLAVGIWLVLLAVAGGGIIAFSRRIRRAVRLDALLRRLPGRVGATLQKVDAAVFHYRGHATGIALWLLVGMANHAVNVGSWVFVGRALGVDLPPLQYFVLIPVISIVSAVPIAPNGWGVGEALFSKLFGDWGAANLPGPDGRTLMATQGVALSLLYRIHLTLWSLLGGMLLLFDRNRVTRDELESELAREEREADEAAADPAAG